MKILVLLSALVLVAYQVQADPIQGAEEETKTEEQPSDEDQDVSVSFEGPEASALQDFEIGRPVRRCRCRANCGPKEYATAFCAQGPFKQFKFCCT